MDRKTTYWECKAGTGVAKLNIGVATATSEEYEVSPLYLMLNRIISFDQHLVHGLRIVETRGGAFPLVADHFKAK